MTCQPFLKPSPAPLRPQSLAIPHWQKKTNAALQGGAVPTAAARRTAATRALVSSWQGRPRLSSNPPSHQPAIRRRSATAASRGQQLHQHLHQHHQVNPPVEVSPSDDADNGDDPPGGTGGDGNEDGCGVIQEATATAPTENLDVGGRNRSRGRGRGRGRDGGRGTEQGRGLGEKDESGDRQPPPPSPSSSSRPFHPDGNRRFTSLVGLGDLPDAALARAFFSGFLDSLEVASSLRLVSRRMMAVASIACQVTHFSCYGRPPV